MNSTVFGVSGEKMARQARQKSESGIYHVMLRGINHQRIFEDEEDAAKFMDLLSNYKKRCGYALYGYCLMDNHVHLLIHEAIRPSVLEYKGRDIEAGEGENLEMVFKRLGVAYVAYFNRKYQRSGHLFQDRFKSEPITDDAYLLMALRYIHRNPVKAGICAKPEDYTPSSYWEYLGEKQGRFADVDYVLGIINREQLIQYTNENNNDTFLDAEEKTTVSRTDKEAASMLTEMAGVTSAAAFQKLEKEIRYETMRSLNQAGVNISQISRLTGYSRQTIYRVLER